jgi:hypothetical protein
MYTLVMLSYEFKPLHVSSLEELKGYEAEIVRRIQAVPNGGHLLLADPLRLLRDVGLQSTPEALEQLKSSHREFFQSTGREYAYDAMQLSRPGDEIRVTVQGLFRRGKA